eukprot:scaffold7266_cov71-Cylindrotheca_fusiformis.AAC.4
MTTSTSSSSTTTTTTTTTTSATTTTYWALDSNQNELDPKLKAAQELAFQEHLEFVSNENNNNNVHEQKDDQDDQIQEPLILRNLLSGEQIDQILTKASAFGVWPRGGIGKHSKQQQQQCEEKDGNAAVGIELCSVPHHYAWTQDHVVLYMHNKEPNWFVDALPSLWCIIRGAMESRPSSWMDGDGDGVFPVLDEAWVGSEQSMKRVRCIELHHYSTGGGLLIPGHRDTGSDLTISILLSDPKDDENDDNDNKNNGVSGGDFVTYKDGIP